MATIWLGANDFPRQPMDDRKNQPWRAVKFDRMFDPGIDQALKARLAQEYAWLVMAYVLAGNTHQPGKVDFDVCSNPVRPWFHMPFQTYDAASGREFIRGLTREAPVTFSTLGGTGLSNSTMWAVAYFNSTAAYTIGKVWQKDGAAIVPSSNLLLDEGSVVAKPLFNTSTIEQLPVLTNMPAWKANISDPAFCGCKPSNGAQCTQVEMSQQCPCNHARWQAVRLLQYDFSVRDSRARNTGWVFGTFVADGLRKAKVKDPWHRMSVLGVMWGNDTPPKGKLAVNTPENPHENGFKEEVIVWDVVDEPNARTGTGTGTILRAGHLGSNSRLNGPADNANSSCLSCHGTASVPDGSTNTPPLLTPFSDGKITLQSVSPLLGKRAVGLDRTGAVAQTVEPASFTDVDALYFANVMAGTSSNTSIDTPNGRVNLIPPSYPAPQQKEWLALDYSMQLSISLTQWMTWPSDLKNQVYPHDRMMRNALRRNVLGRSCRTHKVAARATTEIALSSERYGMTRCQTAGSARPASISKPGPGVPAHGLHA